MNQMGAALSKMRHTMAAYVPTNVLVFISKGEVKGVLFRAMRSILKGHLITDSHLRLEPGLESTPFSD